MRPPLTPAQLAAIEASLSPERLARYRAVQGGDQAAGLALYEWNMAASEGFYRPLQVLEIVMRNALGNALRAQFGADWYMPGIVPLHYPQPEQLTSAREELTRRNVPLEHGRILAELNFGFWTGILSSRYETQLWRPLFRKVFAHGPAKLVRNDIHAPMERLRRFRNRIAHHEPIYDRTLADDYTAILSLISWVDPLTAHWCDTTNQVSDVLAARP